MQQLEAAARVGHAAEFFSVARSALLEAEGAEDGGEDTREIFALADEANYSGHELLHDPNYARWTEVVRRRILPKTGA